MARDPSENVLGIDIDDRDDRRRGDADDTDEEEEELEQFVLFELGDTRFAVPVESVRTLVDVPEEMTRVPRAPPAIEGMMDLRGEITAVVDPHVHFPSIDADDRSGREQLLVLDRPADQQSAALHVDDVIGVESVPVRNVVDEAIVENRPLSGDALVHPLVEALIEQEHDPAADVGTTVASNRPDDGPLTAGGGIATGTTGTTSAVQERRGVSSDDAGTPFSLEVDESEPDEDPADDSSSTREVVVEAIPLVDVEKLLLASGRSADRQ